MLSTVVLGGLLCGASLYLCMWTLIDLLRNQKVIPDLSFLLSIACAGLLAVFGIVVMEEAQLNGNAYLLGFLMALSAHIFYTALRRKEDMLFLSGSALILVSLFLLTQF